MKLNLTTLRKVLLESLYDPKKPGPMKIVLEINNPSYMESKAIELIREAQNGDEYHEKIAKAIQLLATARILREEVQA